MKIFFVRHGQTTANLTKVYSGQHDFLLTDLGKEQAASIRPYMESIPFDKVFSSDLTPSFRPSNWLCPMQRLPCAHL